MNNNNLKLEELLNDYLEISLQGAFYINGEWGIGKTSFIKKFIENKKEKCDKKFIYVSLNGITSTNEINSSILAELHPNLDTIKNNKIYKIVTAFLKGISAGCQYASLDFEKVISNDLLEIKGDLVLVFDDLERCQMDICKTLAYINHFVEDKSFKVIIIGNDAEIYNYSDKQYIFENKLLSTLLLNHTKNEDDSTSVSDYSKPTLKEKISNVISEISDPSYFNSIKEKIIFDEYTFVFDMDIVLSLFKDVIENEYLDRESLMNVVDELGCFNLRSFEYAVYKINDFFSKISKYTIEKDIEKHLSICILLESIWHKNPKLLNKKLNYDLISVKKYEIRWGVNYYLLEPIHNYVKYGWFNREDIYKSIKVLEKLIDNEDNLKSYKCLYKLDRESWYEKADSDLMNLIKEMYQEFENGDYPVKYYFNVFRNIYAYQNKFKFDEIISIEELFNMMESSIANTEGYIEYDDNILVFEEDLEVKKGYERIIRLIQEHNLEFNCDKLNELLKDSLYFSNDAIEKIKNDALENRRFLSTFEFYNLRTIVCDSENCKLINFARLINRVYNFSNLREFFEKDSDCIDKLIALIDEEINKKTGKIRTKNLEILRGELFEVYKKIC